VRPINDAELELLKQRCASDLCPESDEMKAIVARLVESEEELRAAREEITRLTTALMSGEPKR